MDRLLVVGLGNPGDRYKNTRHNVGFMLLEKFLQTGEGLKDWRGLGRCFLWRWTAENPACYRREKDVLVQFHGAMPGTYMNESGRMVRDFARFHKIAPGSILVCYDDLALPLGRVRLRSGGSAGGHKGMQSVLDHLGTSGVPRLRLGIGPLPRGADAKDFVLRSFSSGERAALEDMLKRAFDAVLDFAGGGLDYAMNRHNPSEPVGGDD